MKASKNSNIFLDGIVEITLDMSEAIAIANILDDCDEINNHEYRELKRIVAAMKWYYQSVVMAVHSPYHRSYKAVFQVSQEDIKQFIEFIDRYVPYCKHRRQIDEFALLLQGEQE